MYCLGQVVAQGSYSITTDLFFFDSSDLQNLLQRYVEEYWRDRNGEPIKPYFNSVSGGKDFSLPQPNGEDTQPAGGDTPGKEIDEFPAWVKLFANRLIALLQPGRGQPKYLTYDSHARASQRLVEAFLNAWAKKKLGVDRDSPQPEGVLRSRRPERDQRASHSHRQQSRIGQLVHVRVDFLSHAGPVSEGIPFRAFAGEQNERGGRSFLRRGDRAADRAYGGVEG